MGNHFRNLKFKNAFKIYIYICRLDADAFGDSTVYLRRSYFYFLLNDILIKFTTVDIVGFLKYHADTGTSFPPSSKWQQKYTKNLHTSKYYFIIFSVNGSNYNSYF